MGGSKGPNKMGKKGQKGQAVPATCSEAPRLLGQKPLVAAPADVAAGRKTFLDEMTLEQRALEERKREERERKAKESQQRQLEENARKEYWAKEQQKKDRELQRQSRDWQRTLEATKQRAFQQGVVESTDGETTWWAEISQGLWKHVLDKYYCTLCDKHLNDNTIGSHIDSEGHKKKVEWNSQAPDAASSACASPVAPAAARAVPVVVPEQPSAPAYSWGGPLQAWQEETNYGRRCIPCQKIIDSAHLHSEDHKNRLTRWQEAEEWKRLGYPAPDLFHLAYVPFDESSDPSERFLKCLLCDKWVQDAWSHSGTPENHAGCKEHEKNLRNYPPPHPWWAERVEGRRNFYHPLRSQDDAPRSQVESRPPAHAAQADGAAGLSPTIQTGSAIPPTPSCEHSHGSACTHSDEDSRLPPDGNDSPEAQWEHYDC